MVNVINDINIIVTIIEKVPVNILFISPFIFLKVEIMIVKQPHKSSGNI